MNDSLSSGVYVSMLSAPLVHMGRTEDVGVRIGMCFTVVALGAVAGPPISGAINAATGGFKFTGIYAGTRRVLFFRCNAEFQGANDYARRAHRICRHGCCCCLVCHAYISPWWQGKGQVLNWHHNGHAQSNFMR